MYSNGECIACNVTAPYDDGLSFISKCDLKN